MLLCALDSAIAIDWLIDWLISNPLHRVDNAVCLFVCLLLRVVCFPTLFCSSAGSFQRTAPITPHYSPPCFVGHVFALNTHAHARSARSLTVTITPSFVPHTHRVNPHAANYTLVRQNSASPTWIITPSLRSVSVRHTPVSSHHLAALRTHSLFRINLTLSIQTLNINISIYIHCLFTMYKTRDAPERSVLRSKTHQAVVFI